MYSLAHAQPGTGRRGGTPRPTPAASTPAPSRAHACPCGGHCPRCHAEAVGSALHQPGAPLEAGARELMEQRFGHGLGAVRVHTDAQADRAARALRAEAFSAGQHIVFAAGRYAPHSRTGRALLAHELTHTLQSRSGRADTGYTLAAADSAQEAQAERSAAALGRGTTPPAIGAPSVAPTLLQRQPQPGAERDWPLIRGERCPSGACHGAPRGIQHSGVDFGRRFTPGAASANQALNILNYLPDDESAEFASYLLKGYTKQSYRGEKINYVVPVLQSPYVGQSEIVGYVVRYGTDNLGWRVTMDRYGKVVDVHIAEAPIESEGLGPLDWVPLVGLAGRGAGALLRGGARMFARKEAAHIGGDELASVAGRLREPWFNPSRELELPGVRAGAVPNNCLGCVSAVEKTRLTKELWTEERIAAEYGETSNMLSGRDINLQSARNYFERATGKPLSQQAYDLGANRLTPGHYLVFGGESTATLKHVVRATVKQDGRLIIFDPQIAAKPSWFEFIGKWGRGSRAYRIED